ncbi:MAG: exosortase U [Planctomycetota bacterium]
MSGQRPSKISALQRDDWISIIILLLQLPFVFKHLTNLWQFRPHYEFFPVALVIVVWLFVDRWPKQAAQPSSQADLLATCLLGASIVIMAVGVIFVSPWLAVVAFLISLAAVIVRMTGSSARELFAPWLLCWMIVPPPFGVDFHFMRGMQTTTAQFVSKILDWSEVNHVLAGSVFQLDSGQLFVAEACSGFHGQLLLVSVALLMAVYWRRSVQSTVWLVGAAAFWSLIANIARVSIIVLLSDRYGYDLTHGWIHTMLGISLMAVGFVLLLSTDQLVCGLAALWDHPDFPKRSVTRTDDQTEVPLERLVWDKVLGSSNDHGAVVTRKRLSVDGTYGFADLIGRRIRPLTTFAMLIAILGSLQVIVLASGETTMRLRTPMMSLRREVLPERHGPWLLKEYETEQRERGSDQGAFSEVWKYVSQSATAQVSVDYPFHGWHDLSTCYSSRGWTPLSTKTIEGSDSERKMVQVEMLGTGGQSGLLLFSLFDSQGETMTCETEYWTSRICQSPLVTHLNGSSGRMVSDTTTQVQLFAVSDAPLEEHERDQLVDLFDAARQNLRQAILKEN